MFVRHRATDVLELLIASFPASTKIDKFNSLLLHAQSLSGTVYDVKSSQSRDS